MRTPSLPKPNSGFVYNLDSLRNGLENIKANIKALEEGLEKERAKEREYEKHIAAAEALLELHIGSKE